MRGFIVAIPLVFLPLVSPVVTQTSEPLPGMPPVLDPHDVYSANHPNRLSPVVRGFPERVYVPNEADNTISVIDAVSLKVIRTLRTGYIPEHLTPDWDLSRLYVSNYGSSFLTVVDPRAVATVTLSRP